MTPPPPPLLLLPLALLLALVAPPLADAHTYHVGKCPRVPPMPNFVTSRFLGRWHVLQKTSTRVRCLSNAYAWAEGGAKGAEAKGEWEEEALEREGQPLALVQSMQLPLPAVNNGLRYVGALRPAAAPGAFNARFPLNMFGSASYVVFDTDYTSYAGVYSCQQIALWYRHSASIMARDRKLSPEIIRKLHRQLTENGVNVEDLDNIRHTCDGDADDRGIQVQIKPNVFRNNVTAVLEDANDAMATAADAAKRAIDVYNTVQTVYTSAGRRRRSATRPRPRGGPHPHSDQFRHLSEQERLLLQDWMP